MTKNHVRDFVVHDKHKLVVRELPTPAVIEKVGRVICGSCRNPLVIRCHIRGKLQGQEAEEWLLFLEPVTGEHQPVLELL